MTWLVLLVLALALAWHALVSCPFACERVSFDLRLPRLPPSLHGRRLLFFSDLHLARPSFRCLWLQEQIRDARADLVCIGGDLVDGPDGVAPALDLIGGLETPPLGCWFVPGNNENREVDAEAFYAALERRGCKVLRNEHAMLDLPDAAAIVGVDDPSRERDDLPRALPRAGRPFAIVLSHSPEVFPQAVRRRVDLVLAGHTHGGQVRLPGVGALWTDTGRTGIRYQYGMYREGATTMLLSKGIGSSKLPIRVGCRPEVLLVTLLPADAGLTTDESPPAGWPGGR